jgi:ribosomal protein L37AE/L43A
MEKSGLKVVNKKVMKWENQLLGLMVCKICGSKKHVDIRNAMVNRRWPMGSWQCQHGCKFLEGGKVWNGNSHRIEGSFRQKI